jgi:hypothetical protein
MFTRSYDWLLEFGRTSEGLGQSFGRVSPIAVFVRVPPSKYRNWCVLS